VDLYITITSSTSVLFCRRRVMLIIALLKLMLALMGARAMEVIYFINLNKDLKIVIFFIFRYIKEFKIWEGIAV